MARLWMRCVEKSSKRRQNLATTLEGDQKGELLARIMGKSGEEVDGITEEREGRKAEQMKSERELVPSPLYRTRQSTGTGCLRKFV